MGILLNRLLIILNDSEPSSTDYHIAFLLIINFYSLCDMSIQQVAELCNVSKSTVSKFVRMINFEDYADFRAAATFKENKFNNSLNYNQNIAEFIESEGMAAYLKSIQNDIEECKKSLNMLKIEKLAQYLVRYKKVAAFGLLFSEIAAVDLQTKLAYNGKFIITNMNDVKQDIFINNAEEDTLIIIFSNSGNYMQKYALSEFQETKSFENLKAKIVLITFNKAMEHDPRVDLCITCNHTTSVQTHSYIFQLINDYITMKYRAITRK